MGDAFNPYSHWLKLKPQRWKPTYYDLLGLDRSVVDNEAIVARGKQLYSQVKASPVEGKDKEQRALLAEIEEAVRTLTSHTRRAEYDAALAPAEGEDAQTSSEEQLLAAAPTALAPPKVPRGGAVPTSPNSPVATPTEASSSLLPPAAAPVALPTAIPSATPISSPTAAPVPVAVPVITTAPQIRPVAASTGAKSLAAATAERLQREKARQRSFLIALSAGGAALILILGLIFRGEISRAFTAAPPPPREESSENNLKKQVGVVAEQSTRTSLSRPQPSPVEPPIDPPEMENDAPAPPTMEESEPAPEPTPPPASMPSEDAPPPPKPPLNFTQADAETLAAHCREALAAMKARDRAKVAAALEQAQAIDAPENVKTSIERLAQVAGPWLAFWSAFDEAYAALKVDDEIAVGASTKVKVTKVTETELEIETAAGKRKQSRDSLPMGLFLGLVRSKLDLDSNEGKLALAMFHLVDERGNAEEGKKLLSEANAAALSAELVAAVLESKFDFLAETSVSAMEEEEPTGDASAEQLRMALRERRLDVAARLAEQLAPQAAENRAIAAERELARHATRFWDLVREQFGRFKGTEEIELGDNVVVVIEASAERIVLRDRGQRKEYTLANLPPPLALAIAEQASQKDSPEFALAEGAFYFTSTPPDVEKAHAAWKRAEESGSPEAAENAALLLQLAP